MGLATTLEDPAVTLPADDDRYEIVNGERRAKPPMGAYDTFLAMSLIGFLSPFARERSLGRVVGETRFVLRSEPKLHRRPDAAFVSFERCPRERAVPRTNAWDVVPDLAVEVISRTNLADDLPSRVREYFDAGVRLVWIVFPSESLVYVYRSPVEIDVLPRVAELTGGDVLPGFRLPLDAFFEQPNTEQS